MKYLLISADGHAGPPAHVYREYLDPAFRPAFDVHQEALMAGRMVNVDFVRDWDDETGDVEMRAGYDPEVRDAVLDQEGVVAEVLFPDADVLGTGRLASSPFGSGLGTGLGRRPGRTDGRGPRPQPLAGGLLRRRPFPSHRGGDRPGDGRHRGRGTGDPHRGRNAAWAG